jgi:hypothetical protein
VTPPWLIRKVVDADGGLLFEWSGSLIRPSGRSAYLMADMLRGVIDAGAGSAARRYGFTAAAAASAHQRLPRRLVRGLHAEGRRRRLDWLRPMRTIRRGSYASELAVPCGRAS